jgi:hypothetical protein
VNPILVQGELPAADLFPILKSQDIHVDQTRSFAFGQSRVVLIVGRIAEAGVVPSTVGLLLTTDGVTQRIDLFYSIAWHRRLGGLSPNEDLSVYAQAIRSGIVAKLEERHLVYQEPSAGEGDWSDG